MPDELEERLLSHAKAFDSILALIPAKQYYGEDNSDQWKRKKQTPEQRRAAKIAKLDPDNWKSAKDVLDERSAIAATKRKRDEAGSESDSNLQYVEAEKPKAVQDEEHRQSKKRRTEGQVTATSKESVSKEEKQRRKAERQAAKQEKKQKKKEKRSQQKSQKLDSTAKNTQVDEKEHVPDRQQKSSRPTADEDDEWATEVDISQMPSEFLEDVPMKEADAASSADSSSAASQIFSPPAESGNSSISSVQLENTQRPAKSKSIPERPAQAQATATATVPESLSTAEQADARSRLAAAITNFRAQRKADEPTSSKPRNRQELLEQRRQKEEARRAAKKEQRRKEKEEATRKVDEEIERRFSPGGNGSLLGSPRSPPSISNGGTENFSFGRIEFGDGTEVDTTRLSGLLDSRQTKGPQDVNTALIAAKNKASRLAGLDEGKRKQIEEQDLWLNAKKRAHGERVKDDASLLKKALKRQDGAKKKSEKEWSTRIEGVRASQEAKQKKRTDNLAKRKEDKKAGKGGKSKAKPKVKRPGFEGSFRGRTGGTKKK